MKKLSILIIGLLLVAGFAFGQDAELQAKVTGSATVTFGFDLDGQTAGFTNSISTDMDITLLPKFTDTTGGDSGWWGEISLKNVQWVVDEDATVTSGITVDYAEVTNGEIYVKIYSAASDSIGFASPIEDADYDNDGKTWLLGTEYDGDPDGQTDASVAAAGTITNDAGIKIGYAAGMFNDLSLSIISEGTYESTDATNNVDNEFGVAVAANVQLVPDVLSVAAAVVYSALNETAAGGADLGFAVSPKLTLDDIMGGLTFDVGFDAEIPGGGTLAWELDTNLTLDLDDDGSSVVLGFYLNEDDADAKFVFTEDGEAGFVPGLGATLDLRILDLTGSDAGGDGEMDIRVALDVDYETGGLKIFGGFDYITVADLATDATIGLEAGATLGSDFTGIANTSMTLKYRSEDITGVNSANELFDDDLGDITFAVTVSY